MDASIPVQPDILNIPFGDRHRGFARDG